MTKHHDGFCLWPGAPENPMRPGWRSGRDFTGELAQAARAKGLRFGTYYSGGLDWTFRPSPIANMGEMFAGVPTDDDYRAYAAAQVRDLIARYRPSVLWNDIAWPDGDDLPPLFADYYAAVPDGVVNDRWFGARSWFEKLRSRDALAAFNATMKARFQTGAAMSVPDMGLGDFKTTEYSPEMDHARKWEACRGVGHSFAYNAEEPDGSYLTGPELIRLFAEIVAHGGNLLLNVGPKADGTIVEAQARPLLALGAWLGANGEAIYGTRKGEVPSGTTEEGGAYVVTYKDRRRFLILLEPKPRQALPHLAFAAARRLDGGPSAVAEDGAIALPDAPQEIPIVLELG